MITLFCFYKHFDKASKTETMQNAFVETNIFLGYYKENEFEHIPWTC